MKFTGLFAHVKRMDAETSRRWLSERPDDSYTLIDVREPAEYEEGHIPGAVLIPLSELPDRLSEIDPQKAILTY